MHIVFHKSKIGYFGVLVIKNEQHKLEISISILSQMETNKPIQKGFYKSCLALLQTILNNINQDLIIRPFLDVL